MLKKFLFFLLVFLVSLPVWSQDFLSKKVVKLGETVPDFQLSDTTGKVTKLSDLKGKIVMIHFWSATCPFVARYEERIQQITKDYVDKGVIVLGIDSNVNETQDQIQKVASERNVNYPILIDKGNSIADQFGALTTPHVFLIDREGKLIYEGSVDDQGWGEDNPVTKHYAKDAIEALIAGNPISNPSTQTFGCTVKRAL